MSFVSVHYIDFTQASRSSQSNKLNASNFIPITGDTDLHTLNAGVYILAAGANVSVEKNWPYTGWFFGFIIVFRHKDNNYPDDHGAIICISESVNKVYRQTHAYEKWSEWKEESTATLPQKYSLPLADGWVRVNAAEYWKTQEGIVIVTFRVARENGAEINTSTQIIATLPEGFRPPSDVTPHIAVSTMVVGSGGDRDAVAWVNSSGNIYAQASSQIPAKDGGTPVNWGGFAGTFVFSSGS